VWVRRARKTGLRVGALPPRNLKKIKGSTEFPFSFSTTIQCAHKKNFAITGFAYPD